MQNNQNDTFVNQAFNKPSSEQPTQNGQGGTKKSGLAALLVIVIAVVAFFIIFKGSGVTEDTYIDCSIDLISNTLKDPDSMKVHESRFIEKDDYGRGIVYIDYSANNSFGGTIRTKVYICLQKVDEDGTYTFDTLSYRLEAESTSMESTYVKTLKELNNFGKEP